MVSSRVVFVVVEVVLVAVKEVIVMAVVVLAVVFRWLQYDGGDCWL